MQRSRHPGKWPAWVLGCSLLGLLGGLALGTSSGGPAYTRGSGLPSTPGEFTLRDGRLTARLYGMPLRQVMAEVSQHGDVQVRWLDADIGAQKVSAALTNLPLPEALRRLLRGTNFVLFYASAAEGLRLTHIWIASRREGGGPPAHTEKPTERTAQPVEAVLQTPLSAEGLASSLGALDQLGRRAEEEAMAERR
jgi:hypothetical protein